MSTVGFGTCCGFSGEILGKQFESPSWLGVERHFLGIIVGFMKNTPSALSKVACFLWLSIFVGMSASAAPFFEDGEDPSPGSLKWVPVEELSDEFDGHSLDHSKWQDEPIGNDWVWDGRAPALFKAENVRVEEGELRVTVGKLETPVVRRGKSFTHQGAIVRSLIPGQKGWYFECRMKANATVMSSTFWLMTKYDCERKLELDIQECVGRTTELTEEWGKEWDEIYHSNAIHRKTECNPEKLQLQGSVKTDVKNHQRYFVYGAWWKSSSEIQFFLDGKYMYSINPKVRWDMPAFIQMAIETYSWNPIPADGGLVESGTKDERTTRYDWVRVWKLK